ncbi:EAL domain-containing protein [Novosphingobium sp. FSW06-99]|uniref:EAL domain-containing protein n=1 Tax=Novosphingobium sp. FSW06-99 TaxID=1739113 RepID=UPI0012E36FE9|nr:EAL domain-containing protein [Novosphingobium sp. FSW06-99]
MSEAGINDIHAAGARTKPYARSRPRRERAGGYTPDQPGAGFLFGASYHRSMVAPEWWQIALPMVLGVAVLLLANRAFADWLSPVVALVSAGVALSARLIGRLDHAAHGTRDRMVMVAVMIVAPMFGYGWGIAHWAQVGAVPWLQALAVLVSVALIATMIQSVRLAGLLCGQVAMWAAITCVVSALGGMLAMIIGVAIGSIAYARQREIDLAEYRRLQDAAREQTRAQEILADFEETGQGWFWETDRRGMILYISAPVADLLGRTAEDLVGRPLTDLFQVEDQAAGQSGNRGERTLTFHLSARSSFSDLTVRAAVRDEERWWAITGRPIYDTFDNFQGFRGSGADLTQQRRTQEHVSRLAHFDSLTGLSNRFFMSQSLEKILIAPQMRQRACAVFLIDLDRFKQVNDTLGHPAGDQLLKQVAQRLERGVGSAGRVGRLGGDEFQIILPGRIERPMLAQIAAHIIESLSQSYNLDGSRVMIGASIGIAIAPDDGVTSEALIRNADLALYAAKDGGRGRFHFYAPDLHSDAEERRQLEEDLRDALAHGQLELFYQPVVQTTTEKITGFEALLRWTHPEHGSISPAKFIPIAEDAGLIAQIGEWALRQACSDLAKWPGSVRVAVNVSALQFANPALPGIVTSALASSGVAADRLELEITESVFINDDDGNEAMFRALKRVGVRLALDDFGTGYSSLGYLKKAPFDKIKIDQSFVRGATQPGSRNGAIIASIVSLAEALNMETTAEGVETLDELDLVRLLGCSHVQGYIYERPLSAQAAADRLGSGLVAIARGPRAARALRQSILRRVVLEHGGQRYDANVRNISQSGALVEGLRNVPAGTVFRIQLSDGQVVNGTTRWSEEERMGIEFSEPLELDENGRIAVISTRRARQAPLSPAGTTVDGAQRRTG